MTGFDEPTVVDVEQVNDVEWRLLTKIGYTGKTQRFEVPVGSNTDFASVPRMFVWLLPRYGRYTKAAILHDHLWRVPFRRRAEPASTRTASCGARFASSVSRSSVGGSCGPPSGTARCKKARAERGLVEGVHHASWWSPIVVVPFVLPPALVVLLGTVRVQDRRRDRLALPEGGRVLGPKLAMQRPPKRVNPPSLSFKT